MKLVPMVTDPDMRLNPHLHTVFLDGAYREDDAELTWAPIVHLRTRDVGEILERAVRRKAHAPSAEGDAAGGRR